MEKQKISVKKVLEYKDAVSYIEDLAKSFRSGTIVLESGEEHVVMKPSAQVGIKVEAKVKNDKQKIAFELSWSEASGGDLKIGDTRPETVPAVQPEGGAPAVQPEAKTPAAKTPAMAPAKTEAAKTPAKTASEVPAKAEAVAAPKPETREAAPKKAAAPKAAAKKTATKKTAVKKTPAKKSAAKKPATKKAPAKPAGNK
ncbi:MAG: amphi-Trp domain-containing protein [Pseudodesulfovibrio sp.]|uniref:amphi-Trp domain-containing protein n=1 Tax=Pseudodesulfovibrio sp. TaxID=2035812 RepID=UPI003D1334B8